MGHMAHLQTLPLHFYIHYTKGIKEEVPFQKFLIYSSLLCNQQMATNSGKRKFGEQVKHTNFSLCLNLNTVAVLYLYNCCILTFNFPCISR